MNPKAQGRAHAVVVIKAIRCPQCEGRSIFTTRTRSEGQIKTRYTTCRSCGLRFKVIVT